MHDPRDFVLEIYDTVADPALWPDLLDKFAEQVGARGCIIFEWRADANERRLHATQMSARYDRSKLDGYFEAFHPLEAEDQDRFEALSLAADSIDLIEDSMLFADEATLLARPNVKALVANDMRHRAAGLLDKDNTARSRFSIQLSERHGPMNDEERARVARLLPHVAKALELGRPAEQLAQQHQLLIAAMDQLRIGVCIVDPNGNVAATNEEFNRQCEAYRVFRITASGLLRLHDQADEQRFAALMADALNHGQFGARPRKEAIPVEQNGECGALCIEIAPLNRPEEIGSGTFGGTIVYSLDTSLPQGCDASPLKQVFGLTEAETALAELLGSGLTNAQIASSRDRSVATVNAQVKSLLSKSGCANRTQFVRLMLNFGSDFLAADVSS